MWQLVPYTGKSNARQNIRFPHSAHFRPWNFSVLFLISLHYHVHGTVNASSTRMFTATRLQAVTYLLGVCFFSIAFLVFLNSSLSFVITTLIKQRTHVGDAVGTLGFADELVALVACPAWGMISDRLGVRTVGNALVDSQDSLSNPGFLCVTGRDPALWTGNLMHDPVLKPSKFRRVI